MRWTVEVRKRDSDELVRSISCQSERLAERVERGVHINMDHENYFTCIVSEETGEKQEEGE